MMKEETYSETVNLISWKKKYLEIIGNYIEKIVCLFKWNLFSVIAPYFSEFSKYYNI